MSLGSFDLNRDIIYPYLVLTPNGPPVGHGLFVQLFEDSESALGLIHAPISSKQLEDARLNAEGALSIALENLARFADESPALSIQVLGNPGEAAHFLLYSDHARAASCLLLPDLFEHACEVLQATELMACVPQRESLVVFPKRDRAFREGLLKRLREIEADAAWPLTFELFELVAGSVTAFSESE